MPFVQAVQPGNNVSAIRGVSDRTRALIAQRNRIGVAAQAATYTVTTNNSGNAPALTPATCSIQRLVGASRSVWAAVGAEVTIPSGSDGLLDWSVLVDGTNETFASYQQLLAAGLLTGITPGWHTFALQVYFSTNGGPYTATFVNPFIYVWPI